MRARGSEVAALIVVTVLFVVVVVVAFAAEGVHAGVAQLLIIPVVIVTGLWGTRVGVILAIVSGILLAFAPQSVATGAPQETGRWVIRLLSLVTAALVIGFLRSRLLDLSRARSRFISTVSHELRTPLTSVVGFSETLWEHRADLVDETMVEIVGFLRRDSFQTSHILDQMILAARLDTGSIAVDQDSVDLRSSLVQVIENLPPIGSTLNIEMLGQAEANADRLRLRQIFRNLLIHAALTNGGRTEIRIDYTPDRQARIEISYEGGQAISDLGRHLFAPFYELRQVSETEPVSRWLALTVSRELASLMGGDLQYSHEPGHTRLTLILPAPT